MITAERLREVISYDPETGAFVWRVTLSTRAPAGTRAGSGKRYHRIRIDGTTYEAHRLAWLYVAGVWPVEIDHRNEDKLDNRWLNLRDATHSMNKLNVSTPLPQNLSGFRGVSKKRKRYEARIQINGKCIRLGVFDTAQAAHDVYVTTKRQWFSGQGESLTGASMVGVPQPRS